MRAIPVIRCGDVKRSVAFYTSVLGFQKRYSDASDTDWVIDLVQGDVEIQLSRHAGDGAFGYAINIRVKDVEGLSELMSSAASIPEGARIRLYIVGR